MSDELSLWHIVVVEDNPADVCLVRRALQKAGLPFTLTVLADGAEALDFVMREGKYAAASLPDLVLLDLGLPKYSGTQVLAAMRCSEHLQEVPVIVTTLLASPQDKARTMALGIERQFDKTSDLTEFLKLGLIVRNLLERRNPRTSATFAAA